MKDDILVMIEYFEKYFTIETLNYIESNLNEFKQYSPEVYEEMQGISEALGIDLNKVIGINYIDELKMFCTSIVARNKEGTPIISRNLDYDVPEIFWKILYSGIFVGDKG